VKGSAMCERRSPRCRQGWSCHATCEHALGSRAVASRELTSALRTCLSAAMRMCAPRLQPSAVGAMEFLARVLVQRCAPWHQGCSHRTADALSSAPKCAAQRLHTWLLDLLQLTSAPKCAAQRLHTWLLGHLQLTSAPKCAAQRLHTWLLGHLCCCPIRTGQLPATLKPSVSAVPSDRCGCRPWCDVRLPDQRRRPQPQHRQAAGRVRAAGLCAH